MDHCKEALERYRAVFGGETRILMERNGQVLQAELHLGNSMIHFADTAMAKPAAKGDHVKVMVEFDSEEDLRKAYESLSANGHIVVPLYPTNFGVVLANVTDWNGIGWILKCDHQRQCLIYVHGHHLLNGGKPTALVSRCSLYKVILPYNGSHHH